MSAPHVFRPAAIEVGATYLQHCGDSDLSQQFADLTMFPAGDWAPDVLGAHHKAPEFSLPCQDVAAALALMTTNNICRNCGAETVTLFARKVQKTAMAYAHASAQHSRFRLVSDSLLYWESLQANMQDVAQIALKCVGYYNGSNAVLAHVASQTITAHQAALAPFTIGKVTVNGTTINDVVSINWNQNVQVYKHLADGVAAPTLVAVESVRPVITIESCDVAQMCAYDADGADVTTLEVFLRRKKPNNINYADGDAVHLCLATDGGLVTAGMLRWQRVSGSPSKVSIEIALRRSAPLADLYTVTADTAIT